MKKSELKALIREVIEEAVWGSTTQKIIAGLKGKTIKDVVENIDGSITIIIQDGSQVHFDHYQSFTPAKPTDM
jgi:hypothetical protein